MKVGREYNKAMIAWLTENYPKMIIGDLTEAFNRRFGKSKTKKQIKACLANHNIKAGVRRNLTPVKYHAEHLTFLQKHYLTLNLEQLTEAFNKEFPKFNAPVSSIRCCLRNHKIRSGRTGQFKAGQESWNKGKKGLNTGGEAGWFKKGAVPMNQKPLGYERICKKDGYVLVKVAETNPHTGFPTRFRLKHQVVWEAANGPVPKGMAITFLDGDKTNCSLDNLKLVTRAQMAVINKMGLGNATHELKESALLLANLTMEINKVDAA